MSETIHFSEKFRSSLAKYFGLKSVTEHAYNHDIDQEFSGNDTVHVFEVATTGLNNYDKTVDPSKGSRFGPVSDVGDYQYTFKMTQDVSLDRVIDKSNNNAQMLVKTVGKVMKAYMDKVIRPYKDKYRLQKWTQEAGIHKELASAPTKTTILENIIDLHSDMIDEGVPDDEGTLFIARKYVKALKLAPEWTGLEALGGKTLPKGALNGTYDGLVVQPIPTRHVPEGFYFGIFVKDAIISPEKISTFRAITDSENIDGDRLQYHSKFDAFVMPSQCAGAAVACAKGTVTATPGLSITSNKATVTVTEGAAYYTLDGSDPRYEGPGRKVYSTPVNVKTGELFRCCALAEGKFMSAVAEGLGKA